MESNPVIEVHRMIYGDMSTQGLVAIDGVSRFHTLEPAQKSGMLIAPGTYRAKKTMSPRMHYVSPELFDVPGHDGERIHIGNDPQDTLGCILIGYTRSTNWVGDSRRAFDDFMAVTPDEFELTIYDHPKEIA